jgi:hypothetical protein
LPPDFKGRTPDDPAYAPFDNPDSKLAHCNAEDERKARWKYHRYALSVLDGRREPWARRIATDAEYRDAMRDPEQALPVLMFTGDKAVIEGATDKELAALHRLSPEEIASLQIEAAALRAHARRRVRMRETALASPRPALAKVIRLARDMVNDPPARSIVGGLLHEAMVVSWVGDGGTFKTFTVLALACSVAAGRDFTSQLWVPEKHPVLLMCAEHRRHGLTGDIRARCEVNEADIATLEVHGWDDVVQLGDDEWMAELTGYVAEHGIKLVVFDTQRKATRGLEENSSTDMGSALRNA